MNIYKYVLVDKNGLPSDFEHDTLDAAKAVAGACEGEYAIMERTYEDAESDLVWTPDGSSVWPPTKAWAVFGRDGTIVPESKLDSSDPNTAKVRFLSKHYPNLSIAEHERHWVQMGYYVAEVPDDE